MGRSNLVCIAYLFISQTALLQMQSCCRVATISVLSLTSCRIYDEVNIQLRLIYHFLSQLFVIFVILPHIFDPISSSPYLRPHIFVPVSSTPYLRPHIFVPISSSPYLRPHIFVPIFSSPCLFNIQRSSSAVVSLSRHVSTISFCFSFSHEIYLFILASSAITMPSPALLWLLLPCTVQYVPVATGEYRSKSGT